MAGDEFSGLSWDEVDLLREVLKGYRRAQRRKRPWIILRAIFLVDGRRAWDDDINIPDPEDVEGLIDLGQSLSPGEVTQDDTQERAEVQEVAHHQKEDGTDEMPALREETSSRPQKSKKYSGCRQAILAMITLIAERMTTSQILAYVQSEKLPFSDSTVTKALCFMTKVSHELTNTADSHGRGYGLAEWQ